jgi:hypothetical protein
MQGQDVVHSMVAWLVLRLRRMIAELLFSLELVVSQLRDAAIIPLMDLRYAVENFEQDRLCLCTL